MCTFFHVDPPQQGFSGFRILNITNEDTGEFFQDVKPVNYNTLSTTGFDIEADIFLGGIDTWKNKVDGMSQPIPFEYELLSNGGTGGLDIEFVTTKRPLILGDDGLFNQGLSNYTYYYSQTMNTVTGDVTFNGVTEPVIGTGWIDRQYGTFNPFTGERYEWFSMQLSNGMDLNLWNIFTADRTTPLTPEYRNLSAYVNESTQYTTNDIQIERLQYFCTPDEVQCYSKQWRITSTTNHNIDLIVSILHETTEVQLPFRFFEGSIDITGTVDGNPVTGKGFAELLHAYEDPDVTITSPSGGVYNTSMPITWTLNNPDDGRPVKYDLEYSIDNQQNFNSIATGLELPSYLWNNPPISENDEVWFRITAYSIDGTLTSTIVSDSASTATLTNSNFEFDLVSIYPNPVFDNLNVNFNTSSKRDYTVYDINGKKILFGNKVDSNSIIIDVSSLHSGLYFLDLKSETASKVYKFIKQ